MKISLPWIITLTILIITTYLRFAAISNYNFALTYDQGRDLMEIRSIVVGYRPALVGPTTSINGAFLGPFWFYFNTIPFFISQGNPAFILYWQILWYQLAGLGLFIFFKKKNHILAIISSTLFLLMPTGFLVNRYFWNAHAMPMMVAFNFIVLMWTLEKPSKLKLITLGILNGLALQTQAALGILILPWSIISLVLANGLDLRNGFKKTTAILIGFGLTLIPQLIYDLRHNFIITTTLFQQFTGQTNILSQSLPFNTRLADRYQNFLQIIRESNHLHPTITTGLFIISLIYVLYQIFLRTRKQAKTNPTTYYLLPITLLLLSVILYLIYPPALKDWFIKGLSVPIIMIVSLFLTDLANGFQPSQWSTTFKRYIKYHKLLAATILLLSLIFTIKEQTKHIQASQIYRHEDPSNLSNQLIVIDWIYQQANKQPFQVYSYLPSIYDYSYQHLFWWYGTKTYGYQPTKITYADGVPQYIKSADKLWTKTEPPINNQEIKQPNHSTIQPDTPLTFLIIEPDPGNPQRQTNWLNNHDHLCIIKQYTFPWGTQVQLRQDCKDKTNKSILLNTNFRFNPSLNPHYFLN